MYVLDFFYYLLSFLHWFYSYDSFIIIPAKQVFGCQLVGIKALAVLWDHNLAFTHSEKLLNGKKTGQTWLQLMPVLRA